MTALILLTGLPRPTSRADRSTNLAYRLRAWIVAMAYLVIDGKDQLTKAVLPYSLIARLKAQDEAKDKQNKGKKSDDEERLLRTPEVNYTYDPAGNRTEENYGNRIVKTTFSPANELLTRNDVSYRYDLRGNQIEKILASGRKQQFAYSVANALVSYTELGATDNPNSAKVVEKYAYSPDNERVTVEEVQGKKITHHLWDGIRPIDEWVQSGDVAPITDKGILYLRDPSGQLLEQAKYVRANGTTSPDTAAVPEPSEDPTCVTPVNLTHMSWVHPDHLGSSRVITNAYGCQMTALSYGPTGEELGGNHNRIRYTYTGHAREAKTGNYYSVWRYLDPRAGRWTQRDPLGLILRLSCSAARSDATAAFGAFPIAAHVEPAPLCRAGESILNRDSYSYVHNRPLLLTDLLGLSETYYCQIMLGWCVSGLESINDACLSGCSAKHFLTRLISSADYYACVKGCWERFLDAAIKCQKEFKDCCKNSWW